MFVKLSKNTYIRNYGNLTYVFNRLNSSDYIIRDGEVFTRWLGRAPIAVEDLIDRIYGAYVGVDRATVASDVTGFLQQLKVINIVLMSERIEDIDAEERYFSYSSEHPRTKDDTTFLSKEEVERTPHIVLGKYLNEHPTPLRLHVDVTQACTERCIHCYMPEYNSVFLPFDSVCRVIDEFRDMGGMHITFSGGECMLHPQLEQMMRYAYSKDLTVAILSNLTLCDEKTTMLLKEVEATVQVSLYSMDSAVHDGITKIKGSWAKTKAAIERLHDAEIPCFIACPTMKQNVDGFYKVVEYAQSLNMSAQVDPIIMGKMDGNTSNLDCRLDLLQVRGVLNDIIFKAIPANSEYFSLAKQGELPTNEQWCQEPVCGAGVDSICLDSTGVFYPCPGFAGFKIGNCFENTLQWVWNDSPEMKRLRAIRGKDFKKCKKCEDLAYCSICMCRNFNETGDIFKPVDYFCAVARMNHEILDNRLKKMD